MDISVGLNLKCHTLCSHFNIFLVFFISSFNYICSLQYASILSKKKRKLEWIICWFLSEELITLSKNDQNSFFSCTFSDFLKRINSLFWISFLNQFIYFDCILQSSVKSGKRLWIYRLNNSHWVQNKFCWLANCCIKMKKKKIDI